MFSELRFGQRQNRIIIQLWNHRRRQHFLMFYKKNYEEKVSVAENYTRSCRIFAVKSKLLCWRNHSLAKVQAINNVITVVGVAILKKPVIQYLENFSFTIQTFIPIWTFPFRTCVCYLSLNFFDEISLEKSSKCNLISYLMSRVTRAFSE